MENKIKVLYEKFNRIATICLASVESKTMLNEILKELEYCNKIIIDLNGNYTLKRKQEIDTYFKLTEL